MALTPPAVTAVTITCRGKHYKTSILCSAQMFDKAGEDKAQSTCPLHVMVVTSSLGCLDAQLRWGIRPLQTPNAKGQEDEQPLQFPNFRVFRCKYLIIICLPRTSLLNLLLPDIPVLNYCALSQMRKFLSLRLQVPTVHEIYTGRDLRGSDAGKAT